MRVSKIMLVFLSLLFLIGTVRADIILKAAAVNPSPTEEKRVELRVDLPKEIRPEDVMEMADLEVKYDDKKESYYVAKEFLLKPQQNIVRDIRLRDVWVIPQAELDSVGAEIDKIFQILKGTEFHERIVFLKNSIDSNLTRIISSQNTPSTTPPEHFSKFRENLMLLTTIKSDLISAKTLMGKVKALPPLFTFRLIASVIGFLGIVAGIFLFIWFKMLKVKPEKLEEYKSTDEETDIASTFMRE